MRLRRRHPPRCTILLAGQDMCVETAFEYTWTIERHSCSADDPHIPGYLWHCFLQRHLKRQLRMKGYPKNTQILFSSSASSRAVLPKLWCCGSLWTTRGPRDPLTSTHHVCCNSSFVIYYILTQLSFYYHFKVWNLFLFMFYIRGVCLISLFTRGSTQKASLGSLALE